MRNKMLASAVVATLLIEGCSSRPRDFKPNLTVSSTDMAAFDQAYAACRQLYVAGKLDSNGRLASGAAGAAAGGAVALGGAAAATSAGLYAGAAVASATIVAIPFVAIAGAWGLAKAKQKRKEKAIQQVMGGCLLDRGFQVASWTRAPKAKPLQPAETAKP
jgi:hypothetical protein